MIDTREFEQGLMKSVGRLLLVVFVMVVFMATAVGFAAYRGGYAAGRGMGIIEGQTMSANALREAQP